VMLSKGVDCLFYGFFHIVLHNLLSFLLDQVVTVVLAHLLIDAR